MEKVLDKNFLDETVEVFRFGNQLMVRKGWDDEDCFDHDLFVFELKNGRYEFLYGFSVEDGFLVRCYPGKELVDFVNGEAGLEFGVRPVD